MTSPNQKRHDELVALLTEIRDALTRDHLHRLLAEESAAERRDEPVDVIEEPPVGSQVTDKDDDVWERRGERGWKLVGFDGRPASPGQNPVKWTALRSEAPLRLTTDADRERVGLPVDTAPDVDPDEKCDLCGGGPNSPSHVVGCPPGYLDARRWKARAEQAEADVEQLTRERDDLRARVDDLIQERGRAIERYKELRADVEWECAKSPDHPTARILDADDERVRDE